MQYGGARARRGKAEVGEEGVARQDTLRQVLIYERNLE